MVLGMPLAADKQIDAVPVGTLRKDLVHVHMQAAFLPRAVDLLIPSPVRIIIPETCRLTGLDSGRRVRHRAAQLGDAVDVRGRGGDHLDRLRDDVHRGRHKDLRRGAARGAVAWLTVPVDRHIVGERIFLPVSDVDIGIIAVFTRLKFPLPVGVPVRVLPLQPAEPYGVVDIQGLVAVVKGDSGSLHRAAELHDARHIRGDVDFLDRCALMCLMLLRVHKQTVIVEPLYVFTGNALAVHRDREITCRSELPVLPVLDGQHGAVPVNIILLKVRGRGLLPVILENVAGKNSCNAVLPSILVAVRLKDHLIVRFRDGRFLY
ncbi:hypothetical protein, partial [Methanomethylophilus alvi]|uniref:hypothetical protein n=1 Tax=Methanomethylophilus alvi TaxID=1291540 RepID=UPI0037DC617B